MDKQHNGQKIKRQTMMNKTFHRMLKKNKNKKQKKTTTNKHLNHRFQLM
jgi:hypothetical protein